jgi:hypothetical protein
MNEIYGYDNELMMSLIKKIKENSGKNLSQVFREFALEENKSAGTIRNLYYAIARRAKDDKVFKENYLSGVDFSTNKGKPFSKTDERELVKRIMLEKLKERSTRSAVLKLAGGDSKTALRYQNKYRAVIKNNAPLYEDIATEIEKETGSKIPNIYKCGDELSFSINALKGEINLLVEKISAKIKEENAKLKAENEKLTAELTFLKEKMPDSSSGTEYFKNLIKNSNIN